jgi:hypothetical protein
MNISEQELKQDLKKRFEEARLQEERRAKRQNEVLMNEQRERDALINEKQMESAIRRQIEHTWFSFFHGLGFRMEMLFWSARDCYFMESDPSNYKNTYNYVYKWEKKGKNIKHSIYPYKGTLSEFKQERYLKHIGMRRVDNFVDKSTEYVDEHFHDI